jgi:hypothetical protein
MLQMAQDMMKVFQERLGTTLDTMADLAESVGVPPVASLIHGLRRIACGDGEEYDSPPPSATPGRTPQEPIVAAPVPPVVQVDSKRPAKKRGAGSRDLPQAVRALTVDDAINGSTYLARIIWSLGVSELEGTGPLRPADMARMIMSRSPVSLEPPNVARYIRRSKPTCIAVDHTEGSSSFYRLNEEGRTLFNEKFKGK